MVWPAANVWLVKLWMSAVAPVGSRIVICTIPFDSVFAVSFTEALIVVETPWVTGLGLALAEEMNAGGTSGTAAICAELGLAPAEFDPETT